jgi:hypothetical protein
MRVHVRNPSGYCAQPMRCCYCKKGRPDRLQSDLHTNDPPFTVQFPRANTVNPTLDAYGTLQYLRKLRFFPY